jgi:hypothetical protein
MLIFPVAKQLRVIKKLHKNVVQTNQKNATSHIWHITTFFPQHSNKTRESTTICRSNKRLGHNHPSHSFVEPYSTPK